MTSFDGYMTRAVECLKEARLLYQNQLYRGACGRAYYAYFDAVRALLSTKGITTKSHSAARGLFSEQFVKTGFFTKRDSTALNELFELRQSGEYDMDDSVSEADALSSIEIAAEFLRQTEAYLRS